MNTESTTGETTKISRRRRFLGSAALGLALVGGAAIVAPAVASAQDAAPTEERGDRLQALVDEGTLTQEQADAISEAGIGHRGKRGDRGARLEATATVLGVTTDDLQAAKDADQSLADVAVANGVPVQNVIDALVDQKQARIDAAVEAGRLTAEEAAEKSADLTERVTERVNTIPSERQHGHRGPSGTEV